MSYSYLLDLYRILDERINQVKGEIPQDHSSIDEQTFRQGRLDCLMEFKRHLEANYHQKLPRRIQNLYKR